MIRSSTTNPDVQLRFTDKEHFFHDLAQLLRSGIPLQRAIEHIGAGRDRAANTSRVLSPLISGGVASAFAAAGFATLDVEILAAGEQSGRMEMACFRLSQYYGRLAAGRRRILTASAYPVFMFHMAAVLLLIPVAINNGGVAGYFKQLALVLGSTYALLFVGMLAAYLARRAVRTSAVAERAICRIPGVGGFFDLGALSRFCLVLSLGIRSADGVLASTLRAGRASQSAGLEAACSRVVPAIRAGSRFAEAIRESKAFPPDLERAFEVAEASGRLDEETSRWADIYQDRFFNRIDALGVWIPRLLFVVIMLLIGASIIFTYVRSYAMVFQLLDPE